MFHSVILWDTYSTQSWTSGDSVGWKTEQLVYLFPFLLILARIMRFPWVSRGFIRFGLKLDHASKACRRITKSLPSDADCNVRRVRLMWRQWRQQKRRVWTVAEPQGGSDQHIHTVQNPASPTGDISLPDTNAKIHGLSFGHTITHPRGSEHISADIDVSACWQEADYKRHRFSFWRELRRTALRKQLKFWITWAEVEQERATAQARDNEQQSIMRLGSSQVMTDNEA